MKEYVSNYSSLEEMCSNCKHSRYCNHTEEAYLKNKSAPFDLNRYLPGTFCLEFEKKEKPMLKEMTADEAIRFFKETFPWLNVNGLYKDGYGIFHLSIEENYMPVRLSDLDIYIKDSKFITTNTTYKSKILANKEDIGKIVTTGEELFKLVYLLKSKLYGYLMVDKDEKVLVQEKVYKYETIGGDTDKFYYEGDTK